MIDIALQKKLQGAHGSIHLDVTVSLESGSFTALSGASGSGKTTLLRILAGLETAQGSINVEDKLWMSSSKNLAPQKRDIGFVFQDYALFEHLSVKDHLLFVSNDRALADELLELTQMQGLKKRLPHTLSGGQKQRLALCRALMKRPKLLLLDEPFSALDSSMRQNLQQELLKLHRRFHLTTLMVSHDPSEIYRMASRVLILEEGRIIKDGTPKAIMLKTCGTQKFAFEGEVVDLLPTDSIYIAVVAIGWQLVEVVLSQSEAKTLHIGDKVSVSTKAFTPTIQKLL